MGADESCVVILPDFTLTELLNLVDLVTDGSQSLLCRASVPFIKFLEDQTEKDSLLGILLYLILYNNFIPPKSIL